MPEVLSKKKESIFTMIRFEIMLLSGYREHYKFPFRFLFRNDYRFNTHL